VRRAFFVGLAILGGSLLSSLQASADGDGQTHVDRMPWLDGESRQVRQGWFGHESHYSQYGEDWGNNGNAFAVHAATEGDATCHDWDQVHDYRSGEYISLARTTAGVTWDWTDYYFHLNQNTCGPNGWTQHAEQGDFLANASNTGTGGIHLHYEPRNGPGPTNSVAHCLSGYCNFCDHDDTVGNPPPPDSHDGELGFQCGEAHYLQWHQSDNAGPGQGAGNAYIGAGMALTYRNIGHWWCGDGHAWDCSGSSNAYYGGTEKAWYSTQAGDSAWHQQFKNSGNAQGNLSSPDACGGTAYWVPHANFIAWLNNAATLKHPRSSYKYAGGWGWYQTFKGGMLLAPTFGGTPTLLTGSFICES
jgi:hypothetical protein